MQKYYCLFLDFKNMKRKFLLFVIPILAVTIFTSCLYKGTDKPQTLEEEMILLTKYIWEIEGKGNKVDTTELGVFYWVMKDGNGILYPKIGDTLIIKYDGYLIDGNLFNTSGNSTISYALEENNDAIKGWNDGLKVIRQGSKVELIIPSTLGFGEKGGWNVPPNNTLIYIIEMVNIKKKKD